MSSRCVTVRNVQIVSPLAGSGSESERLVVDNEGSRIAPLEGPPSEEDFGSLFSYAPSVDQIDIEAWIKEFHLPSGYDYRRPRQRDRACTPPRVTLQCFCIRFREDFVFLLSLSKPSS